ncbi:hypothetical protein BVRB_2g025330 [Beta vulgaris subsp. vulgaris]|nr:hypothetical protein BVRB_2g025330 [Beta vulgaris subsp. vulgaris]
MFTSLSSFKIAHTTSYFTDASIDLFPDDNPDQGLEVAVPELEVAVPELEVAVSEHEFAASPSMESVDIPDISSPTPSFSTSSATVDVSNNRFPVTDNTEVSSSFIEPRDSHTFEPRHSSREIKIHKRQNRTITDRHNASMSDTINNWNVASPKNIGIPLSWFNPPGTVNPAVNVMVAKRAAIKPRVPA